MPIALTNAPIWSYLPDDLDIPIDQREALLCMPFTIAATDEWEDELAKIEDHPPKEQLDAALNLFLSRVSDWRNITDKPFSRDAVLDRFSLRSFLIVLARLPSMTMAGEVEERRQRRTINPNAGAPALTATE